MAKAKFERTKPHVNVVTFPAGTEMVMPGDNVAVAVIAPIALEKVLRFAIREGRRRGE